ncbi:hypothetical protein B0H14DRAFT_2577844 [Mycena olivaceomarginata]|nr:hypothetical protein B0H14DRAFT_2577844 [Mycena olivaceomarginata]
MSVRRINPFGHSGIAYKRVSVVLARPPEQKILPASSDARAPEDAVEPRASRLNHLVVVVVPQPPAENFRPAMLSPEQIVAPPPPGSMIACDRKGEVAVHVGGDGERGLNRVGVVGARSEGAFALDWYGGGAGAEAGWGDRCMWKRWQCRAQMAQAPSAVGEDSCNAQKFRGPLFWQHPSNLRIDMSRIETHQLILALATTRDNLLGGVVRQKEEGRLAALVAAGELQGQGCCGVDQGVDAHRGRGQPASKSESGLGHGVPNHPLAALSYSPM